jgi:threonine synthase
MIATIRAETGEVICPHTAVAVKVAREHLRPGVPMITLATAHPAKFPDAVEKATGIRPPCRRIWPICLTGPNASPGLKMTQSALKSLILERRTA